MGDPKQRGNPIKRQPAAGRARSKRVVGLFVEGSRDTDPHRGDFEKMWELLCRHCGHEGIELHIVGISKGSIIELRNLQPGPAATALVKNATQLSGGKEPLDIVIQRFHDKQSFDRVVIAFDRWPANQFMPAHDRDLACPMRPEVAFVLDKLAASSRLDGKLKAAARELLERYRSRDELEPRTSAMGMVEILFMDPMFEALFVADEPTVRRALEVSDKKPRDWPKFKTRERELDKAVLDPAVRSAIRGNHSYTSAKARWGHAIVKAADPDAALWAHSLAKRLCRALGA